MINYVLIKKNGMGTEFRFMLVEDEWLRFSITNTNITNTLNVFLITVEFQKLGAGDPVLNQAD